MDEHNIEFTYRDIRKQNPTADELRHWSQISGQEVSRFFNLRGAKFRELELATRLPQLSEEEQLALLAEDGLMVRRPLLVGDDVALIGFNQQRWEEALLD